MSYEGYTQYICTEGHYDARDAHDDYWDEHPTCSVCGSHFRWSHMVDQTNGFEEGDPNTFPAPTKKKFSGYNLLKDDHGTSYHVPIFTYEPVGTEWKDMLN